MLLKNCIFIAWITLLVSGHSRASGLDIHNHLFLDHGVPSWYYRGCFTCPLKAHDYSALISTKVNEEVLLKSKMDLVVASIYAMSFFERSLRDSVRAQIAEAKSFVQRHPQWVLARSSREATEALKNKRQVLVLSLEGAAGVLENEEDFREFVSEGPIAMVTPLHLTDDEFGGAAYMWNFHGLVNFISYLKNLFRWNPARIENVRVNPRGLSERGEWLVSRLLGSKVWVDLAHASDKAQMTMISMMAKSHQPLLYSHTSLREFHGAERGLAQWQIEEIKQKGGVVGLLPSLDYLNNTPNAKCDLEAFAIQYRKLANQIGADAITIGSDFNAPVRHLGPGCGLGENGFWNSSQVDELWKAVNQVQPGLADSSAQLKKFLQLWSLVR